MRGGDRAGERGHRLNPDETAEVSQAGERLSLRVADDDDLAVLASVLQDAVIAIGDMRYLSEEKLFVMLASRFRWEAVIEDESEGEAAPGEEEIEVGGAAFERIHCGIAFEGVEAVKVRGIDLNDRGQFLDLLTLGAEEGGVVLTFAGGAAIRLDAPEISCHMRDMGEPWPTPYRPAHALSEGG